MEDNKLISLISLITAGAVSLITILVSVFSYELLFALNVIILSVVGVVAIGSTFALSLCVIKLIKPKSVPASEPIVEDYTIEHEEVTDPK
jgi:hypothetical protein